MSQGHLYRKCAHKSTVCCAVICLQTSEHLRTSLVLLIFAQELTRLRARLHLAKKYFCLIRRLEKPRGLELLKHLSSGGFNRRMCTQAPQKSTVHLNPVPVKPANSACRLKKNLIISNPWQPLLVCIMETGLDWYLYPGATSHFLTPNKSNNPIDLWLEVQLPLEQFRRTWGQDLWKGRTFYFWGRHDNSGLWIAQANLGLHVLPVVYSLADTRFYCRTKRNSQVALPVSKCTGNRLAAKL